MTTFKDNKNTLNYADGISNSAFSNSNNSRVDKTVGVLQAWASEFGTIKAQQAITK